MTDSNDRWVFLIAFVVACASMTPSSLSAAGGTSMVASPGQPAHVSAGWPEGVGELVNDSARTTGWNSWFTEWPNDVNQYAFEIKTTEDLNRLIRKLAAVKSELRQIRLSYLKEPQSLGWVTHAPENSNIPIVFSIGDQSRIDQWYKRVRKPFGQMVFLASPVAVPPTLTIFVQNDSVNLDELTIPDEIVVTSGYVPTVFHRSNTTIEKKREEEAARKPKDTSIRPEAESLDPAAQRAVDGIRDFLKRHSEQNRKPIQE